VISPDCSTIIYVQSKDYKDYEVMMANGWGQPQPIHTFDGAGQKATHKKLQNLIGLLRFDGTHLDFFKPTDASRNLSNLQFVKYRSVFNGQQFEIPSIIPQEEQVTKFRYEGNSKYKAFIVTGIASDDEKVLETYFDENGDWLTKELHDETIGHGIIAVTPIGENTVAYKHYQEGKEQLEPEIFLSIRDGENWRIPLQFLIEGFEKDQSIYFNSYDEVYGEVYFEIKNQIYTAQLPYNIMQYISTIYPERQEVLEQEKVKPLVTQSDAKKPKSETKKLWAIDSHRRLSE
jgi:hypothetical protein